MRDYPDIELYSTDGLHPTPCESYFAACAIFKYLFNEDPGKLNFIPGEIKKSERVINVFISGISSI